MDIGFTKSIKPTPAKTKAAKIPTQPKRYQSSFCSVPFCSHSIIYNRYAIEVNERAKQIHFRIGDLKQAIKTRIAKNSNTINAINHGNDNVIITIFL